MEEDITKLVSDMENLSIKIESLGPRPQVTLIPFLGHQDKRTFASFIKEFNKLATAYSWDAKQMCKMLPIYLAKDAQIIYDGISNVHKSDWVPLVEQLAQKFSIGSNTGHFRRACQTRRQRPGESIPSFADALTQLVEKAYPDGAGFNSNIRKELITDLFWGGIKLPIREQLRHKVRPDNLYMAIQLALEEEEAQTEIAREKLANAQIESINQMQSPQGSKTMAPITKRRFIRKNRDWRQFRGNFQSPIRSRVWDRFQFSRNRPYFNPNWRQRGPRMENRNNNPNFIPLGNKNRFKRRVQDGYKINAISSSPPLWSILTILALSMYGTMGYQICPNFTESTLFAPPEKMNCTIPQSYVYGEYEVEIFVPRTIPLVFQGFLCQKKIIGASTFTFLKLYHSKKYLPDTFEPIPSEDCWKLARNGQLGKKELVRMGENIFRSSSILNLEWGVLGTNYFYEYDYILSIGMVYVNLETKLVRSDLGNFINCSTERKLCESEEAILIWDDPTDFHCPFESAGQFRGLVSDNYILIENLQAAFIFSDYGDGNITDSKTRGCFKFNTFAMENGVFISIPKFELLTMTTSKGRLRIPIKYEPYEEEEDEPYRKKRDISGLKRARKLSDMTTTVQTSTFRDTQSTPLTKATETTISGKSPNNNHYQIYPNHQGI